MNPQVKDGLFKAFTTVHRELFRRTGGRVGGRVGKAPMLLLTTTGRRSGKPHTVPLMYIEDGARKLLVASFGGDDRDPQWYKNLQAAPEATIEFGREQQSVRAATATPEEKAELWPRIVAAYSGYASYQRKTQRDIPVVILTPA
ncbi:MAG TPA: nitroreductase family deazaflavin-dependent oxidoreductase [Acidimicrobiia bacterium]|nr:nitroreductase family deazaflavin-dependent oxidoreductase [Acidimicrobiia bacterium]